MHQEAFSGPGTPGNSASNVENSIFLQHSKPPAGKPKGDCLNYKPIPLKWPALAFLFLVICSLLALLEYIHHLLPITGESGGVPQASMLVPSMSLATLMTSMTTASHHARMAAMETPAINIHRDVVPSKKPPVSFPALNPRRYTITNDTAVTNNTIIQTMNGTNLATNISRPQISLTSQDRCNHTSDGLTHRSCLYPNPGSYASVNGGPMFHITSTCAWEPDPPDGVPFFMTPTHGPCGRNLWISNDTLDCPIRAYSFSCETLYEDSFDDSHLECNEIPYSPNSPVTMFQVDLTLDHSRCVNTMNRCSCDPGEPLHSSNSQPPATQIFSILGETTITTRSADFESTVTSIFTGKDGSPTTLLEPTTVHNGIFTFTTSVPVAINIITATMNEGGQLWANISKTSMDNSLSQSAAEVSDALPTGITNHPITFTQLNQVGVPTATVTDYLETLLDSNGLPTATIIVTLETLTDQNGVPTKTIAEFLPTGTSNSTNSGPIGSTNSTSELTSYFGLNSSRYVIGAFVPILMSTILSMLIQLVDKNIKLMVPFYSLTRAGGATAEDSLCMAPGGLVHLQRSVRFFYQLGQPLSLLSDLLVFSSAILVSISSEIVELKLFGSCTLNDFRGCYISIAVFDQPARAGEALLIIMAIVVVLLLISFSRARSGVASNPWSIATSSSLLSKEIGDLLLSLYPHSRERHFHESQILGKLQGKRFALQYYIGSQGGLDYGVVLQKGGHSKGTNKSPQETVSDSRTKPGNTQRNRAKINSFKENFAGDQGVRIVLLAILCGLLALIIFYDTKEMDPRINSFEHFMDSQRFGVRFLIAALGVIIVLFWDSIFSRITILQPYKYLSETHSYPRPSLSVSPATTAFSTLWTSILQRDAFAGAISFASLLSKFTPLLLSNIPYRITQTWHTHVVCAWVAVSILAFMILVLVWSFFVKWPQMPVDPSTLAGNMYYVCDSLILQDFKGMSTMGEKERNAQIKEAGNKYQFGQMVGVSGRSRIGISYERKKEP